MKKIVTTTKLLLPTISGARKAGLYKCEFSGPTPAKAVITEKKRLVVNKLKELYAKKRGAARFNLTSKFVELNRKPLVLLLVMVPEPKANDNGGGNPTVPTPPVGPVPRM